MRKFETGATRDTDDNKYDYEAFLSPRVLESFAAYMHKNRFQADGTKRDGDNWQKGIPLDAYMKSMFRHFMDIWKAHRGLQAPDIKESLNALLFNAMGMLHETLKNRHSTIAKLVNLVEELSKPPTLHVENGDFDPRHLQNEWEEKLKPLTDKIVLHVGDRVSCDYAGFITVTPADGTDPHKFRFDTETPVVIEEGGVPFTTQLPPLDPSLAGDAATWTSADEDKMFTHRYGELAHDEESTKAEAQDSCSFACTCYGCACENTTVAPVAGVERSKVVGISTEWTQSEVEPLAPEVQSAIGREKAP